MATLATLRNRTRGYHDHHVRQGQPRCTRLPPFCADVSKRRAAAEMDASDSRASPALLRAGTQRGSVLRSEQIDFAEAVRQLGGRECPALLIPLDRPVKQSPKQGSEVA